MWGVSSAGTLPILTRCIPRTSLVRSSKYKQINSEGYKRMGEGGAHETDSNPHPKPGATRGLGRVVPHHPQGADENACPDGLARGRAGSYGLRDRRDSASKRGDGKALAQALPGRGGRGLARCAPPGRAAQEGYGGLSRALGASATPPSEELGVAVLSLWTLHRLADYMAEQTGIRVEYESVGVHLKAQGIVLSRPQHTITSPDPEYALKKRRSKWPATTSERKSTSTTQRSST